MIASWRQRLAPHVSALIGFLIGACLFTFPGVTRLGSHVIGAGDNFGFVWELWWFHEALFTRHVNPLVNTTLFYPTPQVDLVCSTPVNILPGALLVGLWGPVTAYNLLVLGGLTWAGFGAYWLAWHVTRHRGAAFLAGLIYAFSSVHMSHVVNGHLNVMTIQWVPFAVLALLRLYEAPSGRPGGRGRSPWSA